LRSAGIAGPCFAQRRIQRSHRTVAVAGGVMDFASIKTLTVASEKMPRPWAMFRPSHEIDQLKWRDIPCFGGAA